MPTFVFYQESDGLVVGFRESPYVGDPAKEAASRGIGILWTEVPTSPKPQHSAKIVNGVMEETAWPIPPPVPDPDAELVAAIQATTTFQELKNALLGLTGRAGIVKARPL